MGTAERTTYERDREPSFSGRQTTHGATTRAPPVNANGDRLKGPLQPSAVLSLQPAAGNAAVSAMLSARRAGARPLAKPPRASRTGPAQSNGQGRIRSGEPLDVPHDEDANPVFLEKATLASCPVQACDDDGASANGARPALQRVLDSSATRRMEPATTDSAGRTSDTPPTPERSDQSGAGEEGSGEGAGSPSSDATLGGRRGSEGRTGEEGSPAQAAAQTPSQDTSTGTDTAPTGERAEPGGGGGVNAACYRADDQDPSTEPDEAPEEPERNEAREEVSSETPEAEDVDECPVETSVQTAAPDGSAQLAVAGARGGVEPATGESEASGGSGPEAAVRQAGAGAAGASGRGSQQQAVGEAGAEDPEMTAARAPLDEAIGLVESSRGEAAAASAGTAATLESVASQAQASPRDVMFLQQPTARSVSEPGEGAAEDQVTSFLGAGEERVQDVLAVGREVGPSRLDPLAHSTVNALDASIEGQKAVISARIEQARADAYGQAESARQFVMSGHMASIARIEAETSSALQQLAVAHQETLEVVDSRETTALHEVN